MVNVVQLCFNLIAEKAGAEGSAFTNFGTAYVPVAELREITAKFHSLLNNISVVSAPPKKVSIFGVVLNGHLHLMLQL